MLLVRNDEDQTQSVYAINAAMEQATEMVAALTEALRMVEKEESGPLNWKLFDLGTSLQDQVGGGVRYCELVEISAKI